MKTFLGIILLCFLSISGKADTTGVYRVLLHGAPVATASEWDTINITLNAKDLKATDTLFIDYWSCGPRYAGHQLLVVADSTSKKEVLKMPFDEHAYIVPLNGLIAYETAHPGTVFTGTFYEQNKNHHHIVRFRLVIN